MNTLPSLPPIPILAIRASQRTRRNLKLKLLSGQKGYKVSLGNLRETMVQLCNPGDGLFPLSAVPGAQ